jgi:hypothetical protein
MDVDDLARRLSVGLGSPGICLPCLGEVAHILETDPKRRRGETWFMTTLWAEGLGVSVTAAVERAVAIGIADAGEAQDDLRARGPRSAIFRATVRRLARELAEETRRAMEAAMN